MPILKIGLDEKTHRAFKVWCAGERLTMQEAVVGFIRRMVRGRWDPDGKEFEDMMKEAVGEEGH